MNHIPEFRQNGCNNGRNRWCCDPCTPCAPPTCCRSPDRPDLWVQPDYRVQWVPGMPRCPVPPANRRNGTSGPCQTDRAHRQHRNSGHSRHDRLQGGRPHWFYRGAAGAQGPAGSLALRELPELRGLPESLALRELPELRGLPGSLALRELPELRGPAGATGATGTQGPAGAAGITEPRDLQRYRGCRDPGERLALQEPPDQREHLKSQAQCQHLIFQQVPFQ